MHAPREKAQQAALRRVGDGGWLLAAVPGARRALAVLRSCGFADPNRALANLASLTPTPWEAELFTPALPGLGGGSQILSDTLRRHPTFLHWLLEPATMRQWAKDELARELARDLTPFSRAQARWNVLRRFKYRHLLRIGSRDLLGDADLTVTTEELSRVADVVVSAAWQMTAEGLNAQHGVPLTPTGKEVGLAVIAMGKLGGEELNYSSDIDLIFVYGEDGETSGGPGGALPNSEYFDRVACGIVAAVDSVTEEGHAFRVDLRRFLTDYQRRTAEIRAVYTRVFSS